MRPDHDHTHDHEDDRAEREELDLYATVDLTRRQISRRSAA